jgi:hypothetical protein
MFQLGVWFFGLDISERARNARAHQYGRGSSHSNLTREIDMLDYPARHISHY